MMLPQNTSVIDTTPRQSPTPATPIPDAVSPADDETTAQIIDTRLENGHETGEEGAVVNGNGTHDATTPQPHDDIHDQSNGQPPASPPASASASRPTTPLPPPSHSDSAPGDEPTLESEAAANTKKRKLAELQSGPRSRSGSRPISPPWKKFGAEGPTAFLDNGKRRSGRVNAVPLELQPPSGKRQTRSRHAQSTPAKGQKQRDNGNGANTSAQTPLSRSAAAKPLANGTKATPKPAPVKHEKASPKSTAKKEDATHTTMEDVAAAPASSPVRKTSSRIRNLNQAKQDEAKQDELKPEPKAKTVESPVQSSPRITLKLRRTETAFAPRHPGHVPSIPPFPTLEESLAALDVKEKELEKASKVDENYEGLERARPNADRDRATELNLFEFAEKEARTRLRILEAAEPGGPLSKEKSSLYLPDDQVEPPKQYSHRDHLVVQGAWFRKLLLKERKLHREQAKKVAEACVAKWKERQPQTEEEKEKAEALFFRTIYMQLVKDVKAKWDLVQEEINRRRHAKWEVEEKSRREKRMQEVMERSTNLLDARKAAREAREESLLSAEDSIDGNEFELETPASGSDDDEDGDREDSDVMSDSDSDSDEDDNAADPDANLSPEALRRKYASLPDLPQSPEQSDDEEEDVASAAEIEGENADDKDDDATLIPETDVETAAQDTDAEQTPAELDRDYSNIQLEEVDAALLDDSDESIDMSDEDMTSDEDEDDEEEGSEGEEEEDAGLLGFFGGRERKEMLDVDEPAGGGADETANDGANGTATLAAQPDVIMPDQPIEDAEDRPQEKQLVPPTSQQIDACQHLSVDHDTKQAPTKPDVTMEEADSNRHTPDMTPDRNMLSVDSHGEDRSSQLSLKDDTTAEPTDAESTTSVDLEDASKIAQSQEETPQPDENRKTKVPSLLRGTLREYQHEGLDWLAKLYANQTNGILADEMGLGKTIQTIALLAHLAEEHQIWGPHLIVVPTSVILNWEMEFKKFLPGFKVLSYYGNVEERAQKRKGWSNPDNYNVVITSYQLVLRDIMAIKVPEWHYMILDEAHNIKNFNSQRYRAMIRLKTHARLLLTGTPLQNNIQELWSLLTFLTAGHDGQGMGELHEFEEWFSKPVNEIFMDSRQTLSGEAQKIVNKLHHSLRPYLLRRLKVHVEKQLPGKYEHTVICRLSKRQRQLYDAFMGLSDTKAKLQSGNMVSVSMALMALRKVCNHPDLFEERPIVTSFAMPKPFSKMPRAAIADYEIKDLLLRRNLLAEEHTSKLDLDFLSLNLTSREGLSGYHVRRSRQLRASGILSEIARREKQKLPKDNVFNGSSLSSILAYQNRHATDDRLDKIQKYAFLTKHRTDFVPVYGTDLVERATIHSAKDRLLRTSPRDRSLQSEWFLSSSALLHKAAKTLTERAEDMHPLIQKFACITPNAVAENLLAYTTPAATMTAIRAAAQKDLVPTDTAISASSRPIPDPFHEARTRLAIAFPDKRLLQYDCGKLQRLAPLLRSLTSKGSRALIFTQMTSVLDILESFLNIHGYKYLRLDGSTRIEQRQDMMERFNRDTRIDVFILSSRSGGVGMNLTGADTVIFYDLDWNPQMDRQCQDRAHRIGQMRDVHIYKFVSESTIEVNILKKSNQKRLLDEVVIQEGEFTTDWFKRPDSADENAKLLGAEEAKGDDVAGAAVDKFFGQAATTAQGLGKVLEAVEDAEDVAAAKGQQTELQNAGVEFEEDFIADGKTAASGTPATGSTAGTPGPDGIESVDAGLAETEGDKAEEEEDEEEVVVKADGKEEKVKHIDEYMLRFTEDVRLKGVVYQPPVDRKRARLDRNGRDRGHRAKRIR